MGEMLESDPTPSPAPGSPRGARDGGRGYVQPWACKEHLPRAVILTEEFRENILH